MVNTGSKELKNPIHNGNPTNKPNLNILMAGLLLHQVKGKPLN